MLLNHKAEAEHKAPSNPVQHPCSFAPLNNEGKISSHKVLKVHTNLPSFQDVWTLQTHKVGWEESYACIPQQPLFTQQLKLCKAILASDLHFEKCIWHNQVEKQRVERAFEAAKWLAQNLGGILKIVLWPLKIFLSKYLKLITVDYKYLRKWKNETNTDLACYLKLWKQF